MSYDSSASGDEMSGKPDPSDVPTLSRDEVEYDRDADGNLKPVEKVVEVDGQWRKVSIKPLLPTEAEGLSKRFEGREDVELEEILNLLDEYIVEPSDVDWHNSARLNITMACVEALFEEMGGQGDDAMGEIEEELDKRQGDNEGN